MSAADMARLAMQVASKRVRYSDTTGRRQFGASTDMVSIAGAIECANNGLMAEICDLESEILMLDPALAANASKRFGVLQAADWDLTPPQGLERADQQWAAKFASEVHTILSSIPSFPELIFDISWSLFDGRGASEAQWERGAWGFRIAPVAFDWIHPRRLGFGATRELRLVDPNQLYPFSSQHGICLEDDPGKFISWKPRLFREHHEREGLGPRSLYWAFFKRFDWRHRMHLTELFAIPWRIIHVDKDALASEPDIERARADVDELSSSTSAVLGRGLDLSVEWPGESSGELFTKTHEACNAELTKLWLGTTGTVDSDPTRASAIVAKGEQDIHFQRDGNGVSRRIQPFVTTIVRMLHGDAAAVLAPKFQIRTQRERDRDKELARVDRALTLGVHIAESELREVSGFRAPADGERFLRMGPSSTDASGAVVPGRVEIVDPSAEEAARAGAPAGTTPTTTGSSSVPQIDLTPSDVATIVTVNEARASQGLPPLATAEGDLMLVEFKAKHAATIAAATAATDGSSAAPAGTSPVLPGADKAPPADEEDDTLEERGTDGAAQNALRDALGLSARVLRLAASEAGKVVPASAVYGSPEVLVTRGAKDGARASTGWADDFATACDGADGAVEITRSLARADVDLEAFARAIERRLVHSVMLGAMDSDWEAENDAIVRPPAFSLGGVRDFVASPFMEALREFKAKNVLHKRAFERLTAKAKTRAFTVATLAKTDMLQVAKDELSKALEDGDDLRKFSSRLRERFDAAGWTQLNPSHVETVFRTNIMGAYARGRDEQMTQPDVLAARPFWQCMGVNDTRTRERHRTALGRVLRADDPFWKRAPLPWGFNCRCRKVSRSERDIKRLGLEVASGASLHGLPDKGWSHDGGL